MRDRNVASTLAGLSVAWGGVLLLVSPANRLLGPPDSLSTKLLEQLALWILAGLIAAIVIYWEKQPLASLNLRPFRWSTVTWGLLLAVVMIYVVLPSLTWVLQAAGLAGFDVGMAKTLEAPVGLRVIAVITAGVVEDTLFIGYAFTRLTGSGWVAGAMSVTVASLLHLPYWGLGPVLAYFVTGGLFVGLFAWRQDLMANIIAHVAVDGVALVAMPILTR
ncbi:MAG TPA: CPBP family glutamic-type intramembrane protease [Vicinamibacterales bacterium]|jgi:membrane protease YdiL (CAAX protease family)|nr:CPBP family glutamic-type intramembrane protease [Vicinamibacterales bacterium]|tara:strand:+ start:183 stop:839 length:657 start_codon:yes stop_codon:yes gene_type:complete